MKTTLLLMALLLTGAAFAQDCPVEVTAAHWDLAYAYHATGPMIELRVKNDGTKKIDAIEFGANATDTFGTQDAGMDVVHDDKANINPGKTRGVRMPISAPVFYEGKTVVFWPRRIKFDDGSIWRNDEAHCKSKPAKFH